MVRWIAFDDETAEAVVTRFRRGAAEIEHGDPLLKAVEADLPTVLILPGQSAGRVIMAKVVPTAPTVSYEASGFLGLSDEPVLRKSRPSLPQPKVTWWRKLVGRVTRA